MEQNSIDETRYSNDDVYLNGNDTYKPNVYRYKTIDKQNAIKGLKACDYRTHPKIIASYLKILFSEYGAYDNFLLSIAQRFNPRAINRVINLMIKQHKTGERTIRNPAKYFTFLMGKRKLRRSMQIPLVPVNNKNK